jgi:hypothetical protein
MGAISAFACNTFESGRQSRALQIGLAGRKMPANFASPNAATLCDLKKSFKNFARLAATIAGKLFATYAASNAG